MKLMRILGAPVLFTVLTLTGCADPEDDPALSSPMGNAKKVMSEKELELIKPLSSSEISALRPVFLDILNVRVRYGSDLSRELKLDNSAIPFCDVLDSFTVASEKMYSKCLWDNDCRRRQINHQWTSQYGRTLTEECGLAGYVRGESTPVQVSEKAKEISTDNIEIQRESRLINTVIIDGKRYISPKLYKDIRSSIRDCDRAKHTFMNMTADSPYLTIEMYEEVNKAILSCEVYLTEKIIQGDSDGE